jgi:hypothetical protein
MATRHAEISVCLTGFRFVFTLFFKPRFVFTLFFNPLTGKAGAIKVPAFVVCSEDTLHGSSLKSCRGVESETGTGTVAVSVGDPLWGRHGAVTGSRPCALAGNAGERFC